MATGLECHTERFKTLIASGKTAPFASSLSLSPQIAHRQPYILQMMLGVPRFLLRVQELKVMPTQPGGGCTAKPAPGSVVPFSVFQESLASETRPLQTWPRAHHRHTPPCSPQQCQTEAFHGFKSSTRSSSHRRLEWVTESYSRKKKGTVTFCPSRSSRLSPQSAEAAQPGE